MSEETLFCPACGLEARGRQQIATQFKRLYRPEPRNGLAYPQVYRCRLCGHVFGEPYPAIIEAEYAGKS